MWATSWNLRTGVKIVPFYYMTDLVALNPNEIYTLKHVVLEMVFTKYLLHRLIYFHKIVLGL